MTKYFAKFNFMLAKKNNIRVTTALRMTSSRAEKVL